MVIVISKLPYAAYCIVLYSINKIDNGENKSGNLSTTQHTEKATWQAVQALVMEENFW